MMELEYVHTLERIRVCNVYGSVLYGRKNELWIYLNRLHGNGFSQNRIVVGDFNTTILHKERRGGILV